MAKTRNLIRRPSMDYRDYATIAGIIKSIKHQPTKQFVANHFATEFRKTFKSFDPVLWERSCGGKIQGFNIQTGKFEDWQTNWENMK